MSGRRRAERARAALRDLLQLVLRMAPWPTPTGVRRVGEPGPLSPVIVTGNYDLTVRRVMRALEGLDAWVVAAPSGGINVWCAAAGGHFTTHQVVTALKTSGLERHLRHRNAILPQLAATGVLAPEVARRSGWRVRFGPVRAEDLPGYLAAGQHKDDAMRRVRFGTRERLEMAAAWGGPAALLVGAGAALAHPAWALPLAALAGSMAVACFLVYDRLPTPRRALFGAASALAAGGAALLLGGGPPAVATGVGAAVVLTAVLTFDYEGSTPTAGGSHFEERRWHVRLDRERCAGVFTCWEVCPEACFEKPPAATPKRERKVTLAHEARCIRCGACVVQCPQDALAFEDGDGRRIEPATIRRFKLNLLGRRSVAAEPTPAERA